MSAPSYIGDTPLFFSAEWQKTLMSKIGLEQKDYMDIKLDYINTEEDGWPVELARESPNHGVKSDTFILYNHDNYIIGYICLSLQELILSETNDDNVAVYLNIPHVFILPGFRGEKAITIGCMLAYEMGKRIKKYLLNEYENLTKAEVNVCYNTEDIAYLAKCGNYFCRIFRGQCKPDASEDVRLISIDHEFIIDGIVTR